MTPSAATKDSNMVLTLPQSKTYIRNMKMLDVPQSGSIGGVTSSHNRFGQYKRARSIPVNPRSTQQGAVRARLSANAALWRTLTAAQRAGWSDLAISMNRSDSLGQAYNLTGFMAFVSLNNNQAAAGNAGLTDAPALVTPPTILTAVITTTAGTLSIAYTLTPLGAGARLFTYVGPQRSAGRNYDGDYRLLQVSAAAAASPANALAAYTAKFGAPIVGNKIFFSLRTYTGGFLSGPLTTSVVVTA
jgi:hypothetical protein